MEKETIRALMLFGRKDLTDGTYDLPELGSNIEVFMTPKQMIYYISLETQLKRQKEINKKAIEYIKGIDFNYLEETYQNSTKEYLEELLQILEGKEV